MKFPYRDDSTQAWIYIYYQIWMGKVKAQESEIDALFYWDEDKVKEMIKNGARITPDSKEAFEKFIPKWHIIMGNKRSGK